MTAALEVRGLCSGYGRTNILRDVDLVVERGSVTVLLGPNGAGKTTLLRTASGLLRAQRGVVVLDGRDVTRSSTSARAARGLCHIPEGRGVFRSLTVRENLAMYAGRRGERAATDRGVEAFPQLADRLGQRVGTMSGGQQQMVALARAYVTDPAVVIVDEASLGLAPIVVDQVFAFLGRLVAAGTSLLVVDQFVTRALAMADHVYLLHRGAVAFAGAAHELHGADIFDRYVGNEPGASREIV